jgi:signal transduction histidine kinase
VTAVHVSALHLLEQVNDFLDFSKLEAGQVQINLEPVDLAAVVDDAVSLAQFLAKQAGIEIVVEIAAGLPPAMADAKLATQGVVNLLSNAVKFTAAGGRIVIAAAIGDGRLTLSITDSGIGIARENLPKLAHPFVQIREPGSYARPGTGLGLSLTKAFMDLQGGTFALDSVVGKGTTASLSFRLQPAS